MAKNPRFTREKQSPTDTGTLPEQLLTGVREALESGMSPLELTERLWSLIAIIAGDLKAAKREKRQVSDTRYEHDRIYRVGLFNYCRQDAKPATQQAKQHVAAIFEDE